MRLESFHVTAAEWGNDAQRKALLALRQTVFVDEQHVPEERERDGIDGDCWHVLARNDAGEAIGCGRLTPSHKIGRMAVLPTWRGRGAGAAMLRELIARASAMGWTDVALDAQVSAIGFYERQGFEADGDVFDDAGMPHRMMRLSLASASRQPQPVGDTDALPAGSRVETAEARLHLLVDARHRVSLYAPTLTSDSYASTQELAELQRIAQSGRGAQIRILLHDPAAALHMDHRLITLVQRLPSSMQVRMPVEEADLAYVSAYLINDAGGYLLLPEAARWQGRAARRDRASVAPLQRHFDEVWNRAEPATVLQTLGI